MPECYVTSHTSKVETLNEALKIAALDIANAAGDQLLSDDEVVEEVPAPKKPVKTKATVFVKAVGSYSLHGSL